MGGDTQAAGSVVEGGSLGWSRDVATVLADAVARDIEAGGVGEVEDVEGVLEFVALAEGEDLDE